jgi:hypothetical protein
MEPLSAISPTSASRNKKWKAKKMPLGEQFFSLFIFRRSGLFPADHGPNG